MDGVGDVRETGILLAVETTTLGRAASQTDARLKALTLDRRYTHLHSIQIACNVALRQAGFLLPWKENCWLMPRTGAPAVDGTLATFAQRWESCVNGLLDAHQADEDTRVIVAARCTFTWHWWHWRTPDALADSAPALYAREVAKDRARWHTISLAARAQIRLECVELLDGLAQRIQGALKFDARYLDRCQTWIDTFHGGRDFTKDMALRQITSAWYALLASKSAHVWRDNDGLFRQIMHLHAQVRALLTRDQKGTIHA